MRNKTLTIVALLIVASALAYSICYVFDTGKLINPANIGQTIDFSKIQHDSDDERDKYTQKQYIYFIIRLQAKELFLKDYSDKCSTEESLKKLLLKDSDIHYTLVDLNGDNQDEIIYTIMASGWCGTAGCHYGILQIKDNKVHILKEDHFYPQRPILVLDTKTDGCKDIYINTKSGHGLMKYDKKRNFYFYK